MSQTPKKGASFLVFSVLVCEGNSVKVSPWLIAMSDICMYGRIYLVMYFFEWYTLTCRVNFHKALKWHSPFTLNEWRLVSMTGDTVHFQCKMTRNFQKLMMEAEYFWQARRLSLLTGQFVNGERCGDSVTFQIHHDPWESWLDDQRVESRGRALWGKRKGRDGELGSSLEANNGCTDWCRAVEWCGNHHLCGRGDPAIALGGHAIVIWQLMSHPYFMGKC